MRWCNRGVARPLVAWIAVAVVVAVLAVDAVRPASARSSAARAVCAVTVPPKRMVPSGAGFSAAGFNFGTRYLRAELYWPHGILPAGRLPNGGSYATINPDGSIGLKLGWWRGLPGRLRIHGRRLDQPAPALRADVPARYGSEGFQVSGLTFPTVGCWQVTGTVARAKLTFVVKVTKIAARCPVTVRGSATKPPAAFVAIGLPVPYVRTWLGNNAIWLRLPRQGVIPALRDPNGRTISAKFPWWRVLAGQLHAWAQPVGQARLRITAEVATVAGYGPTGFVPSELRFSKPGCWRITGSLRGHTLSFVARVVLHTP
jgi:hypothetical protein